jgi:response regulator RpfG family c-di-GMP phosphodiesterase
MDIQMPVLDGMAATQKLRALEASGRAPRGARTPVIAMTAHALKGDRERFMDAGMDGYVSKPFSRDVLAAEIARLVAASVDASARGALHTPADSTAAPRAPACTLADRTKTDRTIDDESMFKRFGREPARLAAMATLFESEYERMMRPLADALARKDFAAARAPLHALKGVAAMINAEAALSAATALEGMLGTAPTPDASDVARALSAAEAGFAPYRAWFRRWQRAPADTVRTP